MEKTATAALKLRKFKGLSQAEAARLIGVSVRTWQSWEQGRRNMPFKQRIYFLRQTYVSFHWIILNAKKKSCVLLSVAQEKYWIELKQQMEVLHEK